jgi:hypothetical protein
VVADHVGKARHGTHVQSELVGIAVVVDTALGGKEVVSSTGMKGVINLTRSDNALVSRGIKAKEELGMILKGVSVTGMRNGATGQLVAMPVLQQTEDPELSLQLC